LTTDAGSNILENLREEFKNAGLDSHYLDTDIMQSEIGSYEPDFTPSVITDRN
jgi:hypothetical protein